MAASFPHHASAQPQPQPPRPAAPPVPPAPAEWPALRGLEDLDIRIADKFRDMEFRFDDSKLAKLGNLEWEISDKVNAKVADAMAKADKLRDFDFKFDNTKLWNLEHDVIAKVNTNISAAMRNINVKVPAFSFSPPAALFQGNLGEHERAYENGLRAIEGRHYERALESFSQSSMSASGGIRTDGALFWKAYALHRLGRRDEALAALAELRKSHAASKWSGDAQALESEIKQTPSGQTAAQMDADEDLKVLALSGLMQSDPDRAVTKVEQIVKGSASHRLQDQAIRVLANSDSQKGRDMMAQIARGRLGNPDLQIRAIRHLGNRRTDNRELLREIFGSSTDEHVKKAVLRALGSNEDKDELLRIAKAEKDTAIRLEAISLLGNSASSGELWQLYQAETSIEVKERILNRLRDLGATERLLDVAKTEKESKLKQHAIRALGSLTTGDALVAMHATETDESTKRAIIEALYSHRNGKALIELARKEKDPQMRRTIVQRLSRMDSKEVSDYLVEILK